MGHFQPSQLAKPVPEQREKQIQNMLETVRRIAGAYFDELASRQFLETGVLSCSTLLWPDSVRIYEVCWL